MIILLLPPVKQIAHTISLMTHKKILLYFILCTGEEIFFIISWYKMICTTYYLNYWFLCTGCYVKFTFSGHLYKIVLKVSINSQHQWIKLDYTSIITAVGKEGKNSIKTKQNARCSTTFFNGKHLLCFDKKFLFPTTDIFYFYLSL